MSVIIENMKILGTKLSDINPLPFLKQLPENTNPKHDGTLSDEEKYLFGYQSSRRILPYLMQDKYNRNKKELDVKTIVLENDKCKATFLPEYGGRLYSLYSKILKRELLYKNPVLAPANLAIRNAWFSGGIEWNIGRVGHTFTTFDSVFFAKMTDDLGEEFVRMYEFERQRRLFWQIDFHLPYGAEELTAYVNIINDDEEDKPMYWWTNIAVPLTEKTRVFSCTSEAFYIMPENPVENGFLYGHGKLPYINGVSDMDCTYPSNIRFGSEYFFQNSKEEESPWEAAAYEDGYLFYERSTNLLRTRKMFTWGNSVGGNHWCDYLSLPNQGKYVEIQAGMTPSQLHGMIMPANSTISFVQIFGGMMISDDLNYRCEKYEETEEKIGLRIEEILSAKKVQDQKEKLSQYAEKKPDEILHIGSGFGALEVMRREKAGEKSIPPSFCFPVSSIKSEENIWFELLVHSNFKEQETTECPQSYMTDRYWEKIILNEVKRKSTWNIHFYYGVYLYENDRLQEAKDAFEISFQIKKNPWAAFGYAKILENENNIAESIPYYEKAYQNGGMEIFSGFAETLMDQYLKLEEYQNAWKLYQSEKDRGGLTERLILSGAKAGMENENLTVAEELFVMDLAIIREGENSLTQLWFEYTARMDAREKNIKYTKDYLKKIMQEKNPPDYLEFRMVGSRKDNKQEGARYE